MRRLMNVAMIVLCVIITRHGTRTRAIALRPLRVTYRDSSTARAVRPLINDVRSLEFSPMA